MKQFFTFIICTLISTIALAQMPKAINYQAVARNNSGQALANQSIKVRLSIVNTLAGNATLYSETRNVTTNALGLFNVQIGAPGATAASGDFTTISWANNTSNSKSLKVELDINNSGAFTDMGMQSLVTVPFAFASDEAINAINIGGNYVYNNTPNPGDILKWDGNGWKPESVAAAPKIYNYNLNVSNTTFTGSSSSFVFPIGMNLDIIEVKANQTVTSVISIVLGSSSGSATGVGLSICYQQFDASNNPIGAVTPFYASTYPTSPAISSRVLFTISGTKNNLPPGNYRIGIGVRNVGPVALNNNEFTTGFIMVSNQ